MSSQQWSHYYSCVLLLFLTLPFYQYSRPITAFTIPTTTTSPAWRQQPQQHATQTTGTRRVVDPLVILSQQRETHLFLSSVRSVAGVVVAPPKNHNAETKSFLSLQMTLLDEGSEDEEADDKLISTTDDDVEFMATFLANRLGRVLLKKKIKQLTEKQNEEPKHNESISQQESVQETASEILHNKVSDLAVEKDELNVPSLDNSSVETFGNELLLQQTELDETESPQQVEEGSVAIINGVTQYSEQEILKEGQKEALDAEQVAILALETFSEDSSGNGEDDGEKMQPKLVMETEKQGDLLVNDAPPSLQSPPVDQSAGVVESSTELSDSLGEPAAFAMDKERDKIMEDDEHYGKNITIIPQIPPQISLAFGKPLPQ